MTSSSDWVTLRLQVTTPLFNGGADPDGRAELRPEAETGVRVASLRGVMRYWFRALAGCGIGPDLPLLAELESRVFGSAEYPSPVVMRIPRQPAVRTEERPDFMRADTGKWISYLLGQGLTRYDAPSRGMLLTRPYVAPGQVFDLKARFADDDAGALACAALWLACAYGGAGARVRRGFGGLRIIGADGPLPSPWTEQTILTPDLRYYEQVKDLYPDQVLGACVVRLLTFAGGRGFDMRKAWAGQPPSFPVLSKDWTRAAASGEAFPGWQETLAYAGKEFRHFRASEPNRNPAANYSPKIKTPEWTDVVHGQDASFGLGALGLPVGYKDKYVVNADRGHGHGAEQLRRASPLWLRPVGSGDRWRLLSFAFRGEFLPGPQAPHIHLWHQGRQITERELSVTGDDIRRRTDAWMDALASGSGFSGEAHGR
jgi:hypothetical protein